MENINKVEKDNKPNKELKWLWGWLILVWIGILITPFKILKLLDDIYISMINDWSYAQLISKLSDSYIEWYLPLTIFEFVWNFIFILFPIILIYLFFAKNKKFPWYYKIFLLTNFIFILLDFILSDLIPEIAAIPDNWEYLRELVKSFIALIIWWSYMHISKRVKNTFTEKWKNTNALSIALTFSVFVLIITISIFSKVDIEKFSYNELEYWNSICKENFWENSIYSWEKDNWSFLCDCLEWYDFWWKNMDKCIILN